MPKIVSGFNMGAPVPIDDRMTKKTIAERDAIAEGVRFEGLEVFVEETKIKYRLEGGIANDCWVDENNTLNKVLANLENTATRNLLDIADGEYSTANLTLIAADNKFLIKKITENALTYADRFEFAFTVPSDGDYTLTCFADDAYTVAYDSDGDGENETTTSAHQIYILNNGSAIDGATVRLSNSIRNTYTYSLIAGVTYTLRLMVSSTEVANLFYSENSGIEIAFKLQLEKGRTATEWEDPRKESKYRIPYPVTKEGFEAAVNDLKALIGASVNGLTDVNSVDSEYADVDNVPANKIIRYSTSNLFNTPDGKSGTLVSLAYDKSVENGKIHIFIASDNTLYYRICWKSAWKPWVDTSKHEISLSFDDGARLEIMKKPVMKDDEKVINRTGYIHIAFSVGSKEAVDDLTRRLKVDGYEVISGPRTTGDGYYESCIVGIEGNQIEITV